MPDSVDLLTAGFPCQGLSVAGKRKGLNDARSGLFSEVTRLAERLQPRWLLLENVPGLFSSPTGANGRDFAVILAALDELGYGVAWTCLDAQWFGLAQRRKRVFVVGHLGAPCPPEILFEPESMSGDTPPSREAGEGITRDVAARLRGSGNGSERVGDTSGQDNIVPEVAWALQERDAKGADSDTKEGHLVVAAGFKWQQGAKAGSIGYHIEQAPTLTGRQQDLATQIGPSVRRLTPRECERLQGFPDDWTLVDGMADSPRYRMLGNAVAVPAVEWILRRLKAAGVETMADLFCGIGGFALAARNTGISVKWACEIDKNARQVYEHHFPETPLYGDVQGVANDSATN